MSDNDIDLINHDAEEDANLPAFDGSEDRNEPSESQMADIDRNKFIFPSKKPNS
jgi:hypothetical protein